MHYISEDKWYAICSLLSTNIKEVSMKNIFAAFILFSIICLSHAEKKSFIIQQGQNNYSGSSDTYVTNLTPEDTSNFADSEKLSIKFLSC